VLDVVYVKESTLFLAVSASKGTNSQIGLLSQGAGHIVGAIFVVVEVCPVSMK
jgi:hypothetical protein